MTKLNRKQRRGFTLIELLIVIAVIAILAAIAIPNLLSSRMAANEASAIGSMRTINSAEATYRARNSGYGTMSQLGTGNLIDPALAASSAAATPKSGYVFAVTVPAATTTQFYTIGAPSNSSGSRVFYSDETGVIYAAPAGTGQGSDASGSLGAPWSQIGN